MLTHACAQTPRLPGFRVMQAADVSACRQLLAAQLAGYDMVPVFRTDEEFAHWFLPRDGVVYSYVVEQPGTGRITDLASFYTLPSSVLGHAIHTTIRAAYLFYYAHTSTTLTNLVYDLLCVAQQVRAVRACGKVGTVGALA
jgi:glycylpeptide N-tetradecanoyltransferase